MEYSINKLSRMAGISTRTLRYYDEIGLLKPARVSSSQYRIYGEQEVDTLQQILFFRALGVSLEDIKKALGDPSFDREAALQSHLSTLTAKKAELERLIANVQKTIGALKGETKMRDDEKFEGLKKTLVEENEANYGKEIRAAYGDAVVDASNQKLKGMSAAQYAEAEALSQELNELLKKAVEEGDPAGESAQMACARHKQWLLHFWPDGMYTKVAHMGLGEMYCEDERFRAYYDAIAPGCAELLRDALRIYTRQ